MKQHTHRSIRPCYLKSQNVRIAGALAIVLGTLALAASPAAAAVLTETDDLVTHFDAALGTYTYSGGYSPAANGDKVRWWNDQATDIAGNNAAQQANAGGQPTLVTNALNGLPVLHFSGGQNLLVLVNGTTGGPTGSNPSDPVGTALDTNTISWFTVVSKTGPAATQNVLRAQANGHANEWGTFYDVTGQYRSNSRDSSAGFVSSDSPASTDAFYLVSAVWDGADPGQTVTQWLNGTVASTVGTGANSDGTPLIVSASAIARMPPVA